MQYAYYLQFEKYMKKKSMKKNINLSTKMYNAW